MVDNSPPEYTALDVTSISSYSELMEDVAWGYSRDQESMARLNICMLFGEESKLPIYQTAYNGSIPDVSRLEKTLEEFVAIVPGRLLRIVMDKGFYSDDNVQAVLRIRTLGFLVAAPFKSDFVKGIVESIRDKIENVTNTVLEASHALFGIHKAGFFLDSKDKIHMFVYYNPYTANKAKMELYRDVEELRRSVLEDPKRGRSNAAKKYLCVRKSKKASAGVTVSIWHEAVDEELRYKGWLVLIGNEVMTAQDALDIYRRKDVVEQSFDRLKNVFDMRRLRVHSDQCVRAKLLIGFIAQILTSALYNRMEDTGLLKKLTLHKMLRLLARWRLAVVRGTRILEEETKEQRYIISKLIPDHV